MLLNCTRDAARVELSNTLQWRHNGRNGVSNNQRLDCLLNRLFRHRSKKIYKLRVTGLCEGNSPVTGEFPSQWTSDAEMFPFDDVIMTSWWRWVVVHSQASTLSICSMLIIRLELNQLSCLLVAMGTLLCTHFDVTKAFDAPLWYDLIEECNHFKRLKNSNHSWILRTGSHTCSLKYHSNPTLTPKSVGCTGGAW